MKRFFALLLVLGMAAAFVAGCAGISSAGGSGSAEISEFPQLTWKLACSATEDSTWVKAAQKFAELVGEQTNGAISVDIYPADQLTHGDQANGIQAVMDGTTDLSIHSNLIYSSVDAKFNVVSLPFLFDSPEDADAKLDGAGGDALKKELSTYGLHCIGIGENGFRHPTNNQREIKTPADMRGLKIRVASSDLLNREYALWGAEYVNASWSEVFTGLQTGIYDGQENPLPTADVASIQDVQKYVTYWTGTYDCLFFCMNQELYNSLSPELQKIVNTCGQQAMEYQRQINREQDQEILSRWKSQAGITVTELDEAGIKSFEDAAAPCYDEFAEKITPKLIAAFTGK